MSLTACALLAEMIDILPPPTPLPLELPDLYTEQPILLLQTTDLVVPIERTTLFPLLHVLHLPLHVSDDSL